MTALPQDLRLLATMLESMADSVAFYTATGMPIQFSFNPIDAEVVLRTASAIITPTPKDIQQ